MASSLKGPDLVDGRYTPHDEMRDKIGRFFSIKGLDRRSSVAPMPHFEVGSHWCTIAQSNRAAITG